MVVNETKHVSVLRTDGKHFEKLMKLLPSDERNAVLSSRLESSLWSIALSKHGRKPFSLALYKFAELLCTVPLGQEFLFRLSDRTFGDHDC